MASLNSKREPSRLGDMLERRDLTANSLVGSYFHGGDSRALQGALVGEPSEGIYLCELFEWSTGTSTHQVLFTLGEMLDQEWMLYDSSQWMIHNYEHGATDTRVRPPDRNRY